MKNSRLKIDDALIISRLHYKELLEIKPNTDLDTQYFPLVTTSQLEPFFDNLPIHMGFTLSSVGNQVISIKPERGYFSKGMHHMLANQNIREAMRLMHLLNYESPLPYQAALLMAIDNLCEYKRPLSVYEKVAFSLELNRVVHHAKVVANVLRCIKLFSLAETADYAYGLLNVPSTKYSSLELLAGEQAIDTQEFLEIIDYVMQLFLELRAALHNQDIIQSRLVGNFSLSLLMAANYGLTGSFLRSNRHFLDMRWHGSMKTLYPDPPAKCWCEGGDGYARFTLRLLEIHASLQWIKQQITTQKDLTRPVTISLDTPEPKKLFCHGEIEGPEGVIKISIFRHPEEGFTYKIRSPAYFIAQAIPHMMQLQQVFDLPLLLFSLGIVADEVDL